MVNTEDMLTITDMAINVKNKTLCTGYEACVHICHIGAIDFCADSEGFFYPVVDSTKCIECGACERVCPVIHQNQKKEQNFSGGLTKMNER